MNTLLHNSSDIKVKAYENEVILKYQIYNGLFLGLPFPDPDQAGSRLPIFTKICQDLIKEGYSVPDAVEKYLTLVPIPEENKLHLLNKFLQFIERQVVLFDALEDTAFRQINDMSGYGSIDYLMQKIHIKKAALSLSVEELLQDYRTRLVLTAHPTQFYPNIVLAIIKELASAIKNNELDKIRDLFLQMGLTSFTNQTKPTPSDEADSIIWYLENIFYNIIPQIQRKLSTNTKNLDIGFWPGGDRDGNPFVTAKVTLETANKLRNSILRAYYQDIKHLRSLMTFNGVHELLGNVCQKIKQNVYHSHDELINDLLIVRTLVNEQFEGLFVEKLDDIVLKINLFKFNFAKIDIRQNSAIHRKVIAHLLQTNAIHEDYLALSNDEQLNLILANWNNVGISLNKITDEMAIEVFDTIKAINTIQQINGKKSIERYIISNTDSITSVIEVLWMVSLVNNQLDENNKIRLEVVPLFETVEDLEAAEHIMDVLFNTPIYHKNIVEFGMKQTIMLGFSDGTKDGGYLMANWAIFQAKKRLSKLAKKYSIDVTFFDGRGGPPSRGGGNTYEFYQSVAQEIDAHDIQLTIQGQTISANFGTHDAAIYNFEQLLSAGISGRLFNQHDSTISSEQEQTINELAETALQTYLELRNHPLFLDYLQEITPLNHLAAANIGSRPAKRNKDGKLKLSDLRAIPFGGAWMQMKQNILGYYGFGSAIDIFIKTHPDGLEKLRNLYIHSRFFRGLVNNSMQSLATTNFMLTDYLRKDEKFGEFWQKLKNEAELSAQMLMLISGKTELIVDNQVKEISVEFRESIILPLLMIQQFAMYKLRHINAEDPNISIYERLVRKSLATNINASRNSI